jgi:phage terminase large subunit-like protein
MQRLHEQDLTGHLLERGGWDHLCLPAEYEPKHPFVWPEDKRKKAGELLWPERFGPKEMTRLKADMGSQYTIAGQLQQRPAPREGNLLKRGDWRYYPPELSYYSPREVFGAEQVAELISRVGEFDLICHSWDTSVKDRDHSDFVAGQVWGCRGAHRYLLRLYHARAALNATIEAMLEMSAWSIPLWPNVPQFVLIENTANGPDAGASIRSRVQGVVMGQAKGSKEVRAESAEPALVGHNCFLPGYMNDEGTDYDPRSPADVQKFVEELAVFNMGAHDDQVDAWSSMVIWTRGKTGGVTMSVPSGQARPPRFRDERPTALRPTLR